LAAAGMRPVPEVSVDDEMHVQTDYRGF
jgi:hypothetical protein